MNEQLVLILILVAGLALILGGANYLTDGSASIARRLNVSGFVIGLTIVALGTSMPEMVVSIVSALKGNSDIAIGNVVGSNSFNTLIILGVCSLVRPMLLTRGNIRRDIPMGILASVILMAMAWSGRLSRVEGAAMLLIYIGMMIYSVRKGRTTDSEEGTEGSESGEEIAEMGIIRSVIYVAGGLGALIYGGTLFIDSAVELAEYYAIPSNVIAITLVAGGTSLPEFAASMVSLLKGKSDIALGNVIGSNIANILLVLGAGATLTPLTMGGITMFDIGVTVAASAYLFVAAFTVGRARITRVEGALMVAAYVWYIYKMVSSMAV